MMTSAPKPKDPSVGIIPGSSEASATLVVTEEDHTLGNSLRYAVMRNPDVVFCGYSMPHPSEEKVNLRIQTKPSGSAEAAFTQGLSDLSSMAEHIKATFAAALESDKREAPEQQNSKGDAGAAKGKSKIKK